jgi:hypothetical protein
METDAVVDPRAVVIHFQDARSANTAMMATIRFVLSTPLAMSSLTSFFRLHQAQVLHHFAGIVFAPSLVSPMWIIVWNLAWMFKNASHIAQEQEESDDVEGDRLPHTSRPSGIIPVVGRNIILKHGEAMEEKVDEVQARDGEPYECDRQKLCRLIESFLPLVGHQCSVGQHRLRTTLLPPLH